MTVFSVAQAARLLGIDAKTLHRWLADAHIPLHDHPCDARKKGISQEQFQTLARLHHRHAAPVSAEPPVSMPPLPEALLCLPERLITLQEQVTALHQQVTALTALLQQPVQPPSPPPLPAQELTATKRPLAGSAPRSRPAAVKKPPKPRHVIARVEYSKEGQYVIICPKRGRLPFAPDSPEWFAWVTEQDSFRFVGKHGHFTAHHEWRVPKGAWRAHRHIRNRVHTQRLALNHELTIAVLEHAATDIQALLT
jgi:hypothetical protein